jgi:hypothetical protein
MAGWHHDNADWVHRPCRLCSTIFPPKSGAQKFCSVTCKRKYARFCGSESTPAQYKLISGNWGKYFGRLCTQKGRQGVLTREDCLHILENQQGLCALSGVPMTCILIKGHHTQTNASLDRIAPKGSYSRANVQLVCAVLNKFRVDTPLPEFIGWCRRVADHAVQEQGG